MQNKKKKQARDHIYVAQESALSIEEDLNCVWKINKLKEGMGEVSDS